ncbi:MAG: hypothetical protein WAN81_13180, partial [Candidatus Binataceae bacterium]
WAATARIIAPLNNRIDGLKVQAAKLRTRPFNCFSSVYRRGRFRFYRFNPYRICMSEENAAAAADEPGRIHPRRRRGPGMETTQ